jgi:hypothetical protein
MIHLTNIGIDSILLHDHTEEHECSQLMKFIIIKEYPKFFEVVAFLT